MIQGGFELKAALERDLEPYWDRFGCALGSSGNHSGIILEPFFGRLGIVLESLFDHLGIIVGSLLDNLGIISGAPWDNFWIFMDNFCIDLEGGV